MARSRISHFSFLRAGVQILLQAITCAKLAQGLHCATPADGDRGAGDERRDLLVGSVGALFPCPHLS